eukprot:3809524-Rhodomonas_salina.1
MTANALRFRWDRPSDTGGGTVPGDEFSLEISAYEIQVSPNSDFSSSTTITYTNSTNSESFTTLIDGLQTGDIRYARVRAVNYLGSGSWSTSSSQVAFDVPGAPVLTALSSGLFPTAYIRITWQAPSNTGDGGDQIVPLLDYTFEISTSSSFPSPYSEVVDGSITSNSFFSGGSLSVLKGTTYYMRATARNPAGSSSYSAISSRTVVDVPGKPRNVELWVDGPLAMNMTWQVPRDLGAGILREYPLIEYQVALTISQATPDLTASSTIQQQVLPPDVFQFDFPGLIQGQEYYTFVRARNDAAENSGYGSWSEATGMCVDGLQRLTVGCGSTYLTAITLATAPLNQVLTPIGRGQLQTTWDFPSDAGDGTSLYPLLRYQIETSAYPNKAMLTTAFAKDRSYLASNFEVGAVVTARVRALNDAGWGAWGTSPPQTVLLQPSEPTNFSVSLGVLSVFVSWDRPTQTGVGNDTWAISSYEIKVISGCPPVFGEFSFEVAGTDLMFEVKPLTKGCNYQFQIAAANEAGYGNFTDRLAQYVLGLPSVPLNFNLDLGFASEVLVSWVAPTDTGDGQTTTPGLILFYRLQVSRNSTFSVLVRDETTTETSFDVTLLENQVEYFFRVFGVNEAGEGASAFGPETPRIPPLINVSVVLESKLTGAVTTATVALTTFTALEPGDRIGVYLPCALYSADPVSVSGALLTDSSDTATASTDGVLVDLFDRTCISPGTTLFVVWTSPGLFEGGTEISFSLASVRNRHWAGMTGNFQVKTLNPPGNFTIDQDLSVSGSLLVAGFLPGCSVALDEPRTGFHTVAIITFATSTRNPLAPHGTVSIVFPPEIGLSEVTEVRAFGTASTALLGNASISTINSQVGFTFAPGQSLPAEESDVRLEIVGVRNQIFSGLTGSFQVQTLAEIGAVMDEDLDVASITIRAGNLTNISVSLSSRNAFSSTDVTVCFISGAVGVPAETALHVTFPTTQGVANVAKDSTLSGLDGGLTCAVSGQTVIVNRTQGTDGAEYVAVCVGIRNVDNYYVSPLGAFRLETFIIGDSRLLEQGNEYFSEAIVPLQISMSDLIVSSIVTGSETTVTFQFPVSGTFNFRGQDGGRIFVEFPAGFSFASPPTLEVLVVPSGTLQVLGINVSADDCASCLGDRPEACQRHPWLDCQASIWLELSGGSEWSVGADVQFKILGIRNRPFTDPSGSFSVSTFSAADELIARGNASMIGLIPNVLVTAYSQPFPLIANFTADVTFVITTTNVVPPDCDFEIVFPNEFTFDQGPSASSAALDGNLNLTRQDNLIAVERANLGTVMENTGNLTIHRRAGTLLGRGSTIDLVVSNLRTTEASGATGTFMIRMMTVDGFVMDQNLTVPGNYLRYETPIVRELILSNGPPEGQFAIAIAGENFGPIFENQRIQPAFQRTVSVGHSHCQSTTWTSDTSLTCVVMPGVSRVAEVQVTIENQVSLSSRNFSFDLQSVSDAGASNMPQAGVLLTVSGSGFAVADYSGHAQVGLTASESTSWASTSLITCRASAGFEKSMEFVMTIDAHSSTLSAAISYESPLLSSTMRQNVSDGDGREFALFGRDLGMESYTASSLAGATGSERTSWMSTTNIKCKIAHGAGQSLRIVITSGLSTGSTSGSISYSDLILSGTSVNARQATMSEVSLLTTGNRHQHSSATRMGSTSSEQSNWISETSVQAFPASGTSAS